MRSEELGSFLESKPLYYKEIDHERVHIAYDILKPYIKRPKTIHIVGTNGKGSTGRMIAYLAWRQGTRNEELVIGSEQLATSNEQRATSNEQLAVGNDQNPTHYPLPTTHSSTTHLSIGHYSSPHILRFNERIWLDGKDVDDETLEAAHKRLYGILGKDISDGLSYFEYTTLLAFVVFENCDLMVLEAGLGGEFDATNVCDKELSVITPIGLDHQAFLGDTIEEIAATKIRSIQKKALLAPQPYPEVVEIAKKIASSVGADLCVCPNINDAKRVDTRVYPYDVLKKIAEAKGWPEYLLQNAIVAMQALDILDIPYSIDSLKDLELFGRFYKIADNIHIDVGHNPLAAKAIAEAIEPDTVLVYNSLDDKDYEEVLRILKPKLKRVEIIHIDSQRATTLDDIEKALRIVGLDYSYFDGTIDESEQYLVFGSFYTAEAFLRELGIRS